jgi:hypothetical protein
MELVNCVGVETLPNKFATVIDLEVELCTKYVESAPAAVVAAVNSDSLLSAISYSLRYDC